jgi:type I restriction enzyme, S subunit
MLPTGWVVSPLKNLANIGSGITLNQDRTAKENACRYLTVAHVHRGVVSNEDQRYLELSEEERKTRLLETGDILVIEGHASSMEIGRAAMFEDQGEETTFQNHLFRVRADRSQILPKFLLHVLNSERVQRHWNAVCNTSSGLNTINRRNLRNVLVQHPGADEQQEVIETLDSAELNVEKLTKKIRALEEVKCSLLQNLLTGKIRIPEGVINA